MKLKLTTVDPLALKTVGGNVFYAQGGRAIGRGKVSPVRPLSAAQASEVSGVVGGSRKWAYEMSSTDQAEWESCGTFPDVGFWLWLQIYSSIFSGDLVLDALGTTCTTSSLPVVDSLSVDPAGGSYSIETSVDDADTDTMVIVRVARPLPIGRSPRLADTRVVSVVSPNSETDIASEFIGRFGALPVAGSKILAIVRAVHPDSRRMSGLTFAFAEAGGSSDECSVGAVFPECFEFESIDVDFLAEFASLSMFDLIDVTVLTAGWSLPSGTQVSNEIESMESVTDTDGTPRSESVTFRFVAVDDATLVCEASLVLLVTESGP